VAVDSLMATPSSVLQEILDQLSHHELTDGRHEGDRATRLVDASHALHRAVIALNGVELDERAVTSLLDGGTVDRLVEDLNNDVIQPIFRSSQAMQGVLRRIEDPDVSRCVERAIGQLDEVIEQVRHLMLELHTAADRV
jgi:hypothetical protein